VTSAPAWLSTKYDARAVAARAEEFVTTLDQRLPGFLETLRDNPLDALASFDEVQFRVDDQPQRGSCSILGRYDPNAMPPSIVVTRTSTGQTLFSALHELGHHEQQRDFDWLEALETISDSQRQRTLEEQVCEAFAAEVLLGMDVVENVIGTGTPTASSIAALHEATGASRSACAVRVLQLLRVDALVMMTNLDREILFATGYGDVFTPKRGTVQTIDSIVSRATAGTHVTDRDASVMYGSGAELHGLAGDAVRDGEYVYAVFTMGKPGWVPGGKAYIPAHTSWSKREHDCRCGTTYQRGHGARTAACARAHPSQAGTAHAQSAGPSGPRPGFKLSPPCATTAPTEPGTVRRSRRASATTTSMARFFCSAGSRLVTVETWAWAERLEAQDP
jgi:hypothetical protein